MKVFCIWGNFEVRVFDGVRKVSDYRPNCIEVKHSSSSISYFDLGIDAFLTQEEALEKASKDAKLYIKELEDELDNIQKRLDEARDFLKALQ